MECEVEVLRFKKDKDGGHFVRHKEMMDFPNWGKRELDVCGICNVSVYPECTKYCQQWQRHQKSQS